MGTVDWRNLTNTETELLQALLARLDTDKFGSADNYIALSIDELGSIALRKSNSKESPIVQEMRPLISAYFDDDNQRETLGPLVNIILFQSRGSLCELQIFRSDGSKPKRGIIPSEIFMADRE